MSWKITELALDYGDEEPGKEPETLNEAENPATSAEGENPNAEESRLANNTGQNECEELTGQNECLKPQGDASDEQAQNSHNSHSEATTKTAATPDNRPSGNIETVTPVRRTDLPDERYSRDWGTYLRVKMPNGQIICGRSAEAVLEATIQAMGAKLVADKCSRVRNQHNMPLIRMVGNKLLISNLGSVELMKRRLSEIARIMDTGYTVEQTADPGTEAAVEVIRPADPQQSEPTPEELRSCLGFEIRPSEQAGNAGYCFHTAALMQHADSITADPVDYANLHTNSTSLTVDIYGGLRFHAGSKEINRAFRAVLIYLGLEQIEGNGMMYTDRGKPIVSTDRLRSGRPIQVQAGRYYIFDDLRFVEISGYLVKVMRTLGVEGSVNGRPTTGQRQ